jgi:acetyl esterase/lipase
MTDAKRHPMTLKPVLYTMPGVAEVVTREVPYGDGLVIDLYTPPAATGRLPAVVFVSGYADPGGEQIFGCKLKDMASYVSWAQLVAASGMIGVTYSNHEANDAHAMLGYLRANAAALGIDDQRIALWACSGNVPMALSLLEGARCAALCYGFMGDLDGATETARAAAMFHFATPAIALDKLPAIPLFVVRAGRDEMPGINTSIDRFVTAALTRGLPITLANHPTGPHSFDLVDNSATTRALVRQILAFLHIQLTP